MNLPMGQFMKITRISLLFVFTVVMTFAIGGSRTASAGTVGDIDSDGRVGLKEAIFALQVASGMRPEYGAQYSALGTFACDDEAGILTVNYTASNFPAGKGPAVGVNIYTITSLTEVSMSALSADAAFAEWSRPNGIAGDITGEWKCMINNTSYILAINADNTIRMDGYIAE